MTSMGYLDRLSFTAIWSTPHLPIIFVADSIAAVPKFGSNASISAITEDFSLLAVFDLVSDLSSKLKIVTTIVDTPGSIGFHKDTILSVRDEIVQVPIAGFQAHIGHPDQRDSIPA